MNGVNRPRESDEKGEGLNPGNLSERPIANGGRDPVEQDRDEELSEKKIEQNSAAGVQKHVGEVKAKLIAVPEEIIGHVRDILDGPVMGGERIQEQGMTKRFENKERAFDEGIVLR